MKIERVFQQLLLKPGLNMAGPVFVSYALKKMRKVFYLMLTGIAFGILIVPSRGSDT
jgi:hypothetical protein